MKKKGSIGSVIVNIILILIFMAGLAVFAYPTVSDRLNSLDSSRTIMSYTESVSSLSEEEYERLFSAAEAYNRKILERSNPYAASEEELEEYYSLLNLGGNGVMGYLEVPFINVTIPVCHGTDESVLQVAAGHIDWTSLPVGGASTHAVISGHTGLPSAELFTRLDRLVEGDRFMLYVLNEELTYEVDQIRIVLPEEVEDLRISPGSDYCTLVTCTPYGINTHRILVRGHRVATEKENSVRVTSEAVQIEPVLMAPVAAIPVLLALLAFVMSDRKQREAEE